MRRYPFCFLVYFSYATPLSCLQMFTLIGSDILKMNIDSTTQDSFTISWKKPSAKIDDYKIYYRTSNEDWKFKHITSGLGNNTLSARINGLSSGILYQVKVCAKFVLIRSRI